MTLPLLKIAVVGHTNTGKTSLMRTLLRDVDFGEVSDRPATTRHVEGARILVHGQPLIELYDTPGLEDSIALLDHLQNLRNQNDRRTDGVEVVQQFLASPEAHSRFAQEAKALRQVLASDAALYVIDARDRVLGKHRDELEILACCAKPVVPVLNFTASPQAQTSIWREHLSRVNMHAVAEFDTMVLDEQSERRLLEKMRTLLDRHQATISALIEDRQQQRRSLINASASLIAELLIDVAALVKIVPLDHTHAATDASRSTSGTVNAADAVDASQEIQSLKQRVRQREQETVEQLLALHRFRPQDFHDANVPLVEGKWGADLFSPAALRQFGIRSGTSAAAGAMIGLTLDIMSAGLSLGTGTMIGAAIGALLGTGQTHGRRLLDRIRGKSELRCDDSTIRLLMTRQMELVKALLRRGHASVSPIELGGDSSRSAGNVASALPPEIGEIRVHPHWSRLADHVNHAALASAQRQAVHQRLTRAVEHRMN